MLALSLLLGLLACGGPWLTPQGAVGCDEGLLIEADRLELDISGYDGPCGVDSTPRVTSPASWIGGSDVAATITGGGPVTASWQDSAWITREYYRVDARGPGALNDDVAASVVCTSCTLFTHGYLDLEADYALVEACGPLSGSVQAGRVVFIPPLGNPSDLTGLDDLSLGTGVDLLIGLPAAAGDVVLPSGATRVDVEGCGQGLEPITPQPITFEPQAPSRDWNGAIEVEVETTDDLQLAVFARGQPRAGQTIRWPDRLVFRPDQPFAANVLVTTELHAHDAIVASHAFVTPVYDARRPQQRLALDFEAARVLGPNGPRLLRTPLTVDLRARDDGWQLYVDNACPPIRNESENAETIELHVENGPFANLILRATLDGDALRQVSIDWPAGLSAVVDTIRTRAADHPLGCNQDL